MTAAEEKQIWSSRGTWDSCPVTDVTVDDLDKEALDFFEKKSQEKDRRYGRPQGVPYREHTFDTLYLTEAGYPTRAAVIVFHPSPEKWIPGAFIRILDESGNRGIELHGPALLQPQRALDVLTGEQGKDSFEGEVLRELLLNAVVHRDYSSPLPVTIEINKEGDITISNPGELCRSVTPEMLYKEHLALPPNPLIASIFSRCGMTDSWATGFHKILRYCNESGTNPPVVSETKEGISVCYRPSWRQ